MILSQTEARQTALEGRLFLLSPDAGAGANTFSLLSVIIHTTRKTLGSRGYLPPPPSGNPDVVLLQSAEEEGGGMEHRWTQKS